MGTVAAQDAGKVSTDVSTNVGEAELGEVI